MRKAGTGPFVQLRIEVKYRCSGFSLHKNIVIRRTSKDRRDTLVVFIKGK